MARTSGAHAQSAMFGSPQWLYLDIETLPAPEHELFGQSKAEAGDRPDWDAFERTSLRPWSLCIVSIGWAVDDGPVQALTLGHTGSEGVQTGTTIPPETLRRLEANMVAQWWEGVKRVRKACGFNAKDFDGPALLAAAMRSKAMGVLPKAWADWGPWPKCGERPWHLQQIADLRDAVKLGGYRTPGTQAEVCKALGIKRATADGTDDLHDGSQVYDLWLQGRSDLIDTHVRADVHELRALAKGPLDWYFRN